jgi:ABC-type antimicrobial peptide transport system permease subunit
MFQRYFTSGLRSLWKNGSHTLINLLGLSLGITCSILIFLIVSFELSVDSHQANYNSLYRVVTEYTDSGNAGYSSGSTYPLPVALRNDFPDIKYVALVDANIGEIVNIVYRSDSTREKFKEEKACFADPDYVKMFSYEWVAGNEDALKDEKTVVIAESIAKKYFNDEPALNKVIRYDNSFDVTITGIIKDPPANTDLPFNIIFSSNLGANKRGWENWGSTATSINCFIQLNEGVSKEAFDDKLKDWHIKYFTGDAAAEAPFTRYFLQPLKEMHFDTRFNLYAGPIVSYLTLFTLGAIGMLLLLTACINFINLNTVLIINRSKETGIRKVLGSTRTEITFQFLGEAFLITCTALVISLGLVEVALSFLAPLLGHRIEFHPFSDPATGFFIVMLPIVVALLAGLYPALRLSSFQPVQALKNRMTGQSSGLTLRRGLIVFQLIVSQGLIVATLIMVNQLNYFINMPLGISTQAVVEFKIPEQKPEQIHQLQERLQSIAGVESATASNSGSISNSQWSSNFEVRLRKDLVKESAQIKFANDKFLETYKIQLLVGEDLLPSDTATRFLVNEEFVKVLGLEDNHEALGLSVKAWGANAMISGVVKNFHTKSFRQRIDPVVIMSNIQHYQLGAVRIATQDMKGTIDKVREVWENIYPNYIFEPVFLDDTISEFYESEKKNSFLIGLFAGVAILVGSIGLYGLISFIAKNKTKEIGIRKTLGASVNQIIILFSKEFIILVMIASAISIPLVNYFMEQWLANYAYRIQPGVGIFSFGVVFTCAIVLTTIGIKSYEAATDNPVNALRDE